MRVEIDKVCYLFKSTNNKAENLIISAHGEQIPFTSMVPLRNNLFSGHFQVPIGVTLYFYNPDGTTLEVPKNALEGMIDRKYPIFETKTYPQIVRDYILDKFQTKKDGEETYSYIQRTLANRQALSEVFETYNDAFDVLTIRNRLSTQLMGIRFSSVLELLNRQGYVYPHVHCSFCRSGDFFSKGYRVSPK